MLKVFTLIHATFFTGGVYRTWWVAENAGVARSTALRALKCLEREASLYRDRPGCWRVTELGPLARGESAYVGEHTAELRHEQRKAAGARE